MQFLAPLFFAALAGLAIPVLLHLTQREKKQIIRFPSLMFVRRIPYQSVRRRKIQNWLLLAVRMAALAMIIFAFARPRSISRACFPLAIRQSSEPSVVKVTRAACRWAGRTHARSWFSSTPATAWDSAIAGRGRRPRPAIRSQS